MPQKLPVTGANAIPILLNRRRWGQPTPGHLEAKEEVVKMKVPTQPVTTVAKAVTQQMKPQTSTQQVCAIFQEVKWQWEQEWQLAGQKAEQRLENAPVKKEIPEITKGMPYQITEGEVPKQVCFQEPEENLRLPPLHPFSDDVVRLERGMPDTKKSANPKPEISEEEQYKAFAPTLCKLIYGLKSDAEQNHPRKPQALRSEVAQQMQDRLVKTALLCAVGTDVYNSARKSMTVWFYIHSIAKRTEAVALVDSGVTENFMNLTYAKWLKLPIKQMGQPHKLFNVDGTENKSGELQYYTDLEVRMGTITTPL